MIIGVIGMFLVMAGILVYALNKKGRVRACFRCLGTVFELEVDDKRLSGRYPPTKMPQRLPLLPEFG
jgi:hypothetical protein